MYKREYHKIFCVAKLIFAQTLSMRITLTFFAFVVLLLSACTKDPIISESVATLKEVEYQISTKWDYSIRWWEKDANVSVNFLIGKISLNGTTTVLWDSTFNNLTLGQFSLLPDQISIKKSFPIIEEIEKLTVRYSLIIGEPRSESRGVLYDVDNGVTSVMVPIEL